MQSINDHKNVASSDDGSGSTCTREAHEIRMDTKINKGSSKPFLQLARDTVERLEDTVFATWYDNQGNMTKEYTFRALWQEAGIIAHALIDKGVQKGDRVILCYNFGLHFFAAFLGCLRAGVVAVIVYPPTPPLTKSLSKMNNVIQDCGAKLILTDSDIPMLKHLDQMNPFSKSSKLWPADLPYMATDKLVAKYNEGGKVSSLKRKLLVGGAQDVPSFDEPSIEASDLAFLQYTSGSTGDPKGVMVTFGALAANNALSFEACRQCFEATGGTPDRVRAFSWLPQYHDMGLIAAVILVFSHGWRLHMMSPVSFIQNPTLWIKLMSQHKIHWSVGPDFSFRLVARKFLEMQMRGKAPANLDLSSIRMLSNAAEPVRLDTKELFEEAFSRFGLRPNWFKVAYGLAEHTVSCCFHHGKHLSIPREGEEEDILPMVAVATQTTIDSLSTTIRLVDPVTHVIVPDGTTGEIWLSGPSVAAGYFGRQEQSRETFQAKIQNLEDPTLKQMEFLRTGDLAFFQDGRLYVCGRLKDLIICNGVNYYPQDVEAAVQDSSSLVRPGCVAAFSSNETGDGGTLEIVFEIRKCKRNTAVEAVEKVHQHVVATIGLVPSRVVAIEERKICKTTSGKIQRRGTRTALHQKKLKIVFEKSQHELKDARSETLLAESMPEPCFDLEMGTSGIDTSNNPSQLNKIEEFNRITGSILGTKAATVDSNKSWKELGMSSMASVELRNQVSESLHFTLPVDFENQFRSPRELRQSIVLLSGKPIPVEHQPLECHSGALSWATTTFLQGLGVLMLVLIWTASFIPPFYIGKYYLSHFTWTFEGPLHHVPLTWYWFPLVVPVWMGTFTLSMIVCKWVVVGRYSSKMIPVPSIDYLRWWFVDRLVEVWEEWIGVFVKDSPLLWLVYVLMGANIHPTAKIAAFIREADLVTVGSGASIDHQIRCRRFGPWRDHQQTGTEGPTMRFRPISIEHGSSVQGMVSPGVSLGHSSLVKKLAVVEECAQVPPESVVKGNPAFVSGSNSEHSNVSSMQCLLIGLSKLTWMVVQLYLFYAMLMLSQVLLVGILPTSFRYSRLLYWVLMIGLTSVLSLIVGIVLKWTLIGRRRPGQAANTNWVVLSDWIVDYHYTVSCLALLPFCDGSPVWNVILKLYGMDVDMESKVWPMVFTPSKVDLVHVHRSFITPTARFDVAKDGIFRETRIEDSSIGFGSVVGAEITTTAIATPPLSHIDNIMAGDPTQNDKRMPISTFALVMHWLESLLVMIMSICLFTASLIPSFEVFKVFVMGESSIDVDIPEEAVAMIGLVGVFVLQTISWALLLIFLQLIVYSGYNRTRRTPWSGVVFMAWGVVATNFLQVLSLLPFLYGTLIYNQWIKLLGSTCKGWQFLYFGSRLFDFPNLVFEPKTVVDGAHLDGHRQEYATTTLGLCCAGGLLHEGTCLLADSRVGDGESGPWRFYGMEGTKHLDKTAHFSLHDTERNLLEEDTC